MNFIKNRNYQNKEVLLNNKLLLKELECVCCNKYMIPPIYQCLQGHSVCETCNSRESCLKCGKSMSGIQNIHLENMALKVKYPCKNFEAGCDLLFQHHELIHHEERCNRRLYKCILNNGHCQWTGRKNGIASHVSFSHTKEKIMTKKSMFICRNFKDITYYVRLVKAFKEIFWFYHMKLDNVAYWAVQYIGADINSSKFSYDLIIHDPVDKERYISFVKNACLNDSDNVINHITVSTATIELNSLNNYISDENSLMLTFKLKKNNQII